MIDSIIRYSIKNKLVIGLFVAGLIGWGSVLRPAPAHRCRARHHRRIGRPRDGAFIIVEAIVHRLELRHGGYQPNRPAAAITTTLLFFCFANVGTAQIDTSDFLPSTWVLQDPITLNETGPMLSLDEAIQSALENHPAVRRDTCNVCDSRKPSPVRPICRLRQISWSWARSGISLKTLVCTRWAFTKISICRRRNRAQRELYEATTMLATANLQLTEQQLRKEVSKAWYEVLRAKEHLALLNERTEALEFGQRIAETRFEVGETGRMPFLAMQNRLTEHQLAVELAEKQVKIAVMHFSGWTELDAIAEQFPDYLDQPVNAAIPTSLDATSQVFASQKTVAEQQVKVAESQLLPQLNSGVLFQQVAGDVPFFGDQLGVNMPLFRKGYDARIEAAKAGVAAAETNIEVQDQLMSMKIRHMGNERLATFDLLTRLRDELLPHAEEQMAFAQQAYEAGEVSDIVQPNSSSAVKLSKKNNQPNWSSAAQP